MGILTSEQIAGAKKALAAIGQEARDNLDVINANGNAQALANPPVVVTTEKRVMAIGQIQGKTNIVITPPPSESTE